MHGVGGHHAPGQSEFGEQTLRRRDFVFLLADVDVAERHGGSDVERAHQMDRGAGGEMVKTSPQRFSVEGDNPDTFPTDLVGQNGGVDTESVFRRSGIEALQHVRIEV